MQSLIDLFGGHFMSEVPDPHPVYRTLRDQEPVKLLDLPMAPGYLVTRRADALSVLKDAALYSSRANAKGVGLIMGRTILEMDGKEHSRHRNIVSTAFVPRALLGELPDAITAIAHQLLDGVADKGHAELVAQFTKTLPLRVIAHIIGVPIADYETFQRWSLDIIGFSSDFERGVAAAAALVDFLRPIVESRKREPRNDLLSTLVHAEVDGHRLTDDEVYGFLRLLLPAGGETTYRLIGSTLYALLTHPEQLEEVRADTAHVPGAIEETLRWESPVQLAARETTRSTTLAGVDIPEGAPVLVVLGSANRDERHYMDPNRFDMCRHADDHVAFGFGQHFCLGSHLARLEARIAVTAVLDRLPNLRLDAACDTGIVGLAFRSPNRLPVLFDC